MRLRLTTALGLDQHPATVPGYGTVLAHDALTMITARRDGEWRVVLTDRRGPPPARPARPPTPDHPAPATGTGRGDAAPRRSSNSRFRRRCSPPSTPTITAPGRRCSPNSSNGSPSSAAPARPPDAERRRRRPGAAPPRRRARPLDPGPRPALRRALLPPPRPRADLDHTLAHACGGPTSSWNLGAWCRHHHRAKHHAGMAGPPTQPRPLRHPHPRRRHLHHPPQEILEPLPGPRPAATPRPLPDDGWPTTDDTRDDIDPDWFRKVAPARKARPTAAPPPRRATPSPLHDLDDAPPF